MAKKKGPTVGPNQQNLHVYQRLNFLHQAATLMSTLRIPNPPQSTQPVDTPSKQVNKKWKRAVHTPTTLYPLGQYYNSTMKKIGKRLVLRLDPTIKRTVCKQCDTSLIPAMTCSNHVESQPEIAIVTTCSVCGTYKRFVARKAYALFSEQPDNYTNKLIGNSQQDQQE
ncbi:RNAse P Rpr2/Rpp21/SNM1 subunit domain-containing protein [Spinellus fusiger]|nr:RNAse P Rpr2/Rpp21/SNM1 subunit domain-containing protein [Spinellus fusiger]